MWARDRRRRRRSLAPFIVLGVVAALVLGLLIDGLAHVGTSSAGYRAAITRSYGLATRPLTWSSNQTGRQLRSLMQTMAGSPSRAVLQQELDALVADSGQTAQTSAGLVPPAPPGPASGDFSAAFGDRARAVVQVRAAVDGLLGMTPLPVAGAPALPAQSARAAGTPQVLSADQAANQLIAAGNLLRQADGRYARAVRELRAQPGGFRLPVSNWVGGGVIWSAANLQSLVSQLSTAPSLQYKHFLVLLPQAINLVPAAVPPVSGAPPGVSVIPPTSRLQVSVVVSNQGNVAEPHQTVSLQLQAGAGGRSVSMSQQVSVAAQASQTVIFRHVPVQSGAQYTLNLSVSIPSGQPTNLDTAFSFPLQIAQASPTPTTTTTTRPTTTTTHPTTTSHPTTTTRPPTTTTRPPGTTRPTSRPG